MRFCQDPRCGEILPDNWRYATCEACWTKPCKHGNPPDDCNDCFVEADQAYDAQREKAR